MTAILLDSVKVGSSSWFAARRGNGLKIQGMEDGDRLLVMFDPAIGEVPSIAEDGYFRLPEGVEYVMIEHSEVAARKNGGVCVDLVRRKKWVS